MAFAFQGENAWGLFILVFQFVIYTDICIYVRLYLSSYNSLYMCTSSMQIFVYVSSYFWRK